VEVVCAHQIKGGKSKLDARLHLANAVWQMQSGHWCTFVCWSNALMRHPQKLHKGKLTFHGFLQVLLSCAPHG